MNVFRTKPTFLVLDYDGTLRNINNRTGPIYPKITAELCRIGSNNENNIFVATGRISSALELGRNLIGNGLPKLNMILGNGLEVRSFPSEKIIYSVKSFDSFEKSKIIDCLLSDCQLPEKNISASRSMIRIFMESERKVMMKVQKVIEAIKKINPLVTITHSGINIEILPNGVSKEMSILKLIGNQKKSEVLTVGDSCMKYGNDYGMLSNFSSFCVGTYSKKCIAWTLPIIDDGGNILTGPNATLYLLEHIK